MAGMLQNDAALRGLAYSGETLLYLLDDFVLFGAGLVLLVLALLHCLVGRQVIREAHVPAPERVSVPLYVPGVPLPLHAWHVGAFSTFKARRSAAPEPSARASATQREPAQRRQRISPVVGSGSKVTRRARPARVQRAKSSQGLATTRNMRQVGAVCKSAHQDCAKLSRFESAPTIPERNIPTIVAGTVPA